MLRLRMPSQTTIGTAHETGQGRCDAEAASSHIAAIRVFAPETLSAVLAGQYEIFKLNEHNTLLLEGLHQAGL